MKLLLHIFTLFTFLWICKSKGPNYGTVLFSDADTRNLCWQKEKIALLSSRMVLEDLMPARKSLDFSDDAYVAALVQYFSLIFDVLRKKYHGETKEIMKKALTDIVGGYFKKAVLPMAREAFYNGDINVESVSNLYCIYNEVKGYLKTDGSGWSGPDSIVARRNVPDPIDVPKPGPHSKACEVLIYYQKNVKNSSVITIPMPFLDSCKDPTAIAVPYRYYGLRNIEGKSASYLLVKYFVTSTKCLLSSRAGAESVKKYNRDFYFWIQKNVVPHLQDEKFYTAFGSVRRLMETLKNLGASDTQAPKESGSYNVMFNVGENPNKEEEDKHEGDIPLAHKPKPCFSNWLLNSNTLGLLLILLIIIVVVLFAFLYFYRSRKQKTTTSKKQKSPKTTDKNKTPKERHSGIIYENEKSSKSAHKHKRERSKHKSDSSSCCSIVSKKPSTRKVSQTYPSQQTQGEPKKSTTYKHNEAQTESASTIFSTDTTQKKKEKQHKVKNMGKRPKTTKPTPQDDTCGLRSRSRTPRRNDKSPQSCPDVQKSPTTVLTLQLRQPIQLGGYAKSPAELQKSTSLPQNLESKKSIDIELIEKKDDDKVLVELFSEKDKPGTGGGMTDERCLSTIASSHFADMEGTSSSSSNEMVNLGNEPMSH